MALFATRDPGARLGREVAGARDIWRALAAGWPILAAVLGGTLLTMSTAFLAGRPSVFFDTDGYYLMGENLAQVIKSLADVIPSHGASLYRPVSDDDQIDIAIMGARSPYYGFLLYVASKLGGVWLLAALQALAAAWMIYLTWRTCAPRAPLWSYLALMAGLAAGTTLPLFATFIMPDVFAGLCGLGMILLLAHGDQLSRATKIAVTVLIAVSFSVHTSHSATIVLCTAPAALLLLVLKAPRRQIAVGVALILMAAFASIVAGKLYTGTFEMRTGHYLGRPPFLMARLLADGPGHAYLDRVCTGPQTPFVACQFRGAALARSDDILWEDKPGLGVFSLIKPADQLLMEKQQGAFVAGVVASDPGGVLASALRNWWRQLTKISSHDPLRDPRQFLANEYWQTTRLVDLIPDPRACKPVGPGCRPVLAPTPMKWWHVSVILASALYGLWRLSRPDAMAALLDRKRPWSHEAVRIAAVCVILAALVAVNAAVCGILSGPFARYQARIVWLAPMAAGLIACALGPVPEMARGLGRSRRTAADRSPGVRDAG